MYVGNVHTGMHNDRWPDKLLQWTPLGSSKRGWLRKTWIKAVRNPMVQKNLKDGNYKYWKVRKQGCGKRFQMFFENRKCVCMCTRTPRGNVKQNKHKNHTLYFLRIVGLLTDSDIAVLFNVFFCCCLLYTSRCV